MSPSHYKGPEVELHDRVGHPTIQQSGLVHSTSYSRFFWLSVSGQYGMEIAVLLLLTVPLTAASPLRRPQRSDTDIVIPGAAVQTVGVQRSEETQGYHAPLLNIIPFISEDKHLDLEALKHSTAVRLRPRRALQRGCQLGTCQVHNLANTLYHFSNTSGKEESKRAKDPQGYGR